MKSMELTMHTPGPWTLERDRAKSLSVYSGKTFIGEVWNEMDEPSDQEQANAHLIAAAPELLAEAIELLRNATYQDGQAFVLTQDCEALEAAIRKANFVKGAA